MRVSELCALKIGEPRLHDPERARFLVTDAKTETGIREVEMSPELVEVILAHIDRLRRYGRSTTPEDYVFQNNEGRRMSRQSINNVLTEAAVAASETLCKRNLDCIMSAVYDASSTGRDPSSAIDQMHSCIDAAAAGTVKDLLKKVAYGLLVDDFFYKVIDLEGDALYAPQTGFSSLSLFAIPDLLCGGHAFSIGVDRH